MPIYEYKCTLCKKTCDFLQKFSDPPATHCPHCNQEGLERQISAPSFHLKGSGWYVTDFKNPNKPKTTDNQTSETKEHSGEQKSSDQNQSANTQEKNSVEQKTVAPEKSEK